MPLSDSIPGVARTFHKKFKFILTGPPFTGGAGFMTCSDLVAEIAVIQTSEGGALIPNKSPGRVTFPDITLTRGVTNDLGMYRWFQQAVFTSQIVSESELRQPLILGQLDRGATSLVNAPLRSWALMGCWPVRFKAGDWDSDADEAVIEELTIAIDYFELSHAAD